MLYESPSGNRMEGPYVGQCRFPPCISWSQPCINLHLFAFSTSTFTNRIKPGYINRVMYLIIVKGKTRLTVYRWIIYSESVHSRRGSSLFRQ